MEALTRVCRRFKLGMMVHMDGIVRVAKKDQARGVLTFHARETGDGRRPAVVISGVDELTVTEWCALATVAKALMSHNGALRVC